MTFGALAAVGACVQIAKTLYEYYNIYKHNRALLDILEGFSANLEVGVERLKAREQLFGLEENGQNDALDSIERDFTNAKNWLIANDKNLRSLWTALQAADKLKDLDDRLTKAFASKMSIAIFSALQDARRGVAQIQTTLEGLPTNLETVCRTSTKEAIHEAITELKEEAYQAVGGSGGRARGFRNGEAEKIISQLVDQLAEQERLKDEEEEELLQVYAPLEPVLPYSVNATPSTSAAVPYTSSSTGLSRRSSQVPSSTSDPFEPLAENPFEPTSTSTSRRSSSLRPGTAMSSRSSQRASIIYDPKFDGDAVAEHGSEGKRVKKDKIPLGSIPFLPKDPLTGTDLVDPVLANDGLIHDRWSLTTGIHDNVRDAFEPLVISGDVVQLREAIFEQYPERRLEFHAKRREFKQETIRLYDASSYADVPVLVDRLSHVLLFEPNSISTRIRRAICRYRIRDLVPALEDLDRAVELSKRSTTTGGKEGTGETGTIDLDALRIRALVKTELHENELARKDLELLLAYSPNDVLALSLRAKLRATSGDLVGARDDLASTNLAVRNELAYRSRLGDGECDLEYLARGWAYSSVHDYDSALHDFEFSVALRPRPEPYAVACRALASIKLAESRHVDLSLDGDDRVVDSAMADLDAAIDQWRTLALSDDDNDNDATDEFDTPSSSRRRRRRSERSTSGVERLKCEPVDGLPKVAYQCLLLRESARQARGEPFLALIDFETSIRLRPFGVRDLASLVCALAQIRSECRSGGAADVDIEQVEREFELAVAMAENEYERRAFERIRNEASL